MIGPVWTNSIDRYCFVTVVNETVARNFVRFKILLWSAKVMREWPYERDHPVFSTFSTFSNHRSRPLSSSTPLFTLFPSPISSFHLSLSITTSACSCSVLSNSPRPLSSVLWNCGYRRVNGLNELAISLTFPCIIAQ